VANQEIAPLLGLSVGDPVMYLEQILYLSDGAPIELSNAWFHGRDYKLTATVKRRKTKYAATYLPSFENRSVEE
jgi:hypothetical protein